MSWIILALISTVFFAASGLLDKFILSTHSFNSKSYIICQIFVQQLFIIPIFLFAGVEFTYPVSIFAILLGSFEVIPAIYYTRAIQNEEVSRVSALEYVYLIFVFLGAAVLLGETLTLKHYIGGLLLTVSAVLVSYRFKGSDSLPGISPAIKQFYIYWTFTAFYYLALKYFLASMNEWNFFAWSSVGNLIMAAPLLTNEGVRKDTLNFFENHTSAIGALLYQGTFHSLGVICSISAIALGSVSMVATVGALQPFMTLISVVALSQFKPGLITEELDSSVLMQKFMSVVLVSIGIYFIY
ncbi:EamA-like transporter family protein [uncultured archaeon]|nr:EamA-like transporter family protein [uncultured archaeon]